jgi:hypothetical protein
MWGLSATGLTLLWLTDPSAALVALTLLTAMFACTRISLASHRKTGADVSDSLDHFQQVDEVVVDRILEATVQRLAESGLIIQAVVAPAFAVADPGDTIHTWTPDFYNARAKHRAKRSYADGDRQIATVVSLDQARQTAAS